MAKQQVQTIFLLLMVLFFGNFSCRPQANNQAQIDRSDSLRQDFVFLKSMLNANYPSLYRYTDSVKIKGLFDSCFASINNSTTDIDFLKTIKFLFSALEDGHLYCGSSPQLREYLSERAKMFPLRLCFTGDKAFVLSSSRNGLEAGTEIISVNTKPVNQIRKELFKHIVGDGGVETKKYHILNNWFGFYYLIVYGEQAKFDLTYKSPAGELKAITINASHEKDIPEINQTDDDKNLLSLSFLDDVALLSIKTFDNSALIKNEIDFPSFLDTAFKTINAKKLNKLIIDLRGNGGGRDLYGSLLYSYISNKEFNYYKSLTTATKQLPFDQFASTVSSYNNLSPSMLENLNDKGFALTKKAHNNLQTIQPNSNSFNGKVWFLIDGLSFSTTAEFCAIARSNNRGKFIGEETGGGYYGSTSGVMIDTILPNTEIRFSFGLIEYEMAVSKARFQNRGILPDYVIMPTIDNIIDQKDVQLDFALQLAMKK